MNDYAKKAIRYLFFGLACFIAGLLMHLPGCKGDQVNTVTEIRYISRTDTIPQTVVTKVPVPYKVTEVRADTVIIVKINGHADTVRPQIAYYSDSIRQDKQFKAIITDTVYGAILGRSIQWVDLTPIKEVYIKETILKKPPLVKVFLGAHAVVPVNNITLNRLDVQPEASLLFNDRVLVDAGYEVFSQRINAGLKIKLSFKK